MFVLVMEYVFAAPSPPPSSLSRAVVCSWRVLLYIAHEPSACRNKCTVSAPPSTSVHLHQISSVGVPMGSQQSRMESVIYCRRSIYTKYIWLPAARTVVSGVGYMDHEYTPGYKSKYINSRVSRKRSCRLAPRPPLLYCTFSGTSTPLLVSMRHCCSNPVRAALMGSAPLLHSVFSPATLYSINSRRLP